MFEVLIEATGLPKDSIQKELTALLARRGVSPDDATLDDLREVLAHYLQDALIEAKQEHSQDA
jgi:hypothetical protein